MNRVLLKRADHFEAGAVADMRQPSITMSTEIALQNQTIVGSVEQRTPFFELKYAIRRFLGVDLRHPPVVEKLATAHGIAKMNLPVIFRINVAHGRGDASFGHYGVSLAQKRFAD